jgi:hypothetical protein
MYGQLTLARSSECLRHSRRPTYVCKVALSTIFPMGVESLLVAALAISVHVHRLRAGTTRPKRTFFLGRWKLRDLRSGQTTAQWCVGVGDMYACLGKGEISHFQVEGDFSLLTPVFDRGSHCVYLLKVWQRGRVMLCLVHKL